MAGKCTIFKYISESYVLSLPLGRIPKVYALKESVGQITPTREEWDNGRVWLNGDIFYTDGSKSSHGTEAWLYDVTHLNVRLSISLGRYAAVFQEEIYSILTCALLLTERHDGEIAIKALGSYEMHSAPVLECSQKLEALSETNTLRLVWAPGHSNVLGSQRAGSLAKAGSGPFSIASEPICGVPDE